MVARDDPVGDFIVLRLRKHAARHQVMGVVVGTLGDDAISLMFGHTGQA